MIMLRLWFHLSDTGARNGLGPRLGFVALGEDFFMTPDGVQDGRVVPVPHQAPDLHEREAQLRAQAVAGLVAQVDEGHRPALAAEGPHGHLVLLGYLHEDLARGRLGGRLWGLDGDLNRNGDWRRTVEGIGVRRRGRLRVYEPDCGLLFYTAVKTGADGLVVCVEFLKRHHFPSPNALTMMVSMSALKRSRLLLILATSWRAVTNFSIQSAALFSSDLSGS